MTPHAVTARAYGESAVSVEVPSAGHARELAALASTRPEILDAVASGHSVLLLCDAPGSISAVAEWARRAAAGLPERIQTPPGSLVEITVSYHGPDLAHVAEVTGLSRAEVIARHTAPTYVAAFAGFAPGFVYLDGLDPVLMLPRRAEPRTRVPGGAVAIAHAYTAVYPRPSPGGWHLLGTTTQVMFDVDRPRPALIEPGEQVRFVADA